MSSTQTLVAWLAAVFSALAVLLSIIFVCYGSAQGGKEVDKVCISSGNNTQKVDIIGDNTHQLIKVCILDVPAGYGGS